MLADNDIVVTTYQILSSDASRFDAENGINDDDDNGDDDNEEKMATDADAKTMHKKKKKKRKRNWKGLKEGEHSHPLSKIHWSVQLF